jgi:hypothetical protein
VGNDHGIGAKARRILRKQSVTTNSRNTTLVLLHVELPVKTVKQSIVRFEFQMMDAILL